MRHNDIIYNLALNLAVHCPDTSACDIANAASYLRAGGHIGRADDLLETAERCRTEQTFTKSFHDEEMSNYSRPTASKNSAFVDYHLTKATEKGIA